MATKNNPDHPTDIICPGVSQEVESSEDSGWTWHFLHEGSAADIYSRYNSNALPSATQDAEMVKKVMRVVPTYFKSIAGDRGEDMLTDFRKTFSERFMLWKSLCHSNVTQLGSIEPNEFTLYQDYYVNGDLRKYIKNGISDDNYKCVIGGVLAGLVYLHSCDPPIAHGSVNPGKIFITFDGKVKLGEFGLARLAMAFPHLVPSISLDGMVRWMSPEYFTFKPGPISKFGSRPSSGVNSAEPTTQLDVWSFGCTLFEIMTGRLPYHKYKYDPHVVRRIITGDLPGHRTIDNTGSTIRPGRSLIEIMWQLVDKCWLPVERRLSAKELMTEIQLKDSWSISQADDVGVSGLDGSALGSSSALQMVSQNSSSLPFGTPSRTATTQPPYFVSSETSRIAESSTMDANPESMRLDSPMTTKEDVPLDMPDTELATPRTYSRSLCPLLSHPYEAVPGGFYHDQLNVWSSRLNIPNVKFQTTLTERFTEDRTRLWKAIPVFPQVYLAPRPLGGAYIGRGRSRLEAQEASLKALEAAQLGIDMTLVRWSFHTENGYQKAIPYLYGGPTLLQDPNVFGWGTSKREAKESSSRALLISRQYCII